MTTVVQVVIAGLTSGAIYALIAISYDVIFGASGILNFAQGALLALGSMVGVELYGSRHSPFALALLATACIGGLMCAVEERIAVRPATAKGGSAVGWVVATLGFAIVTEAVVALVFGPDSRAFPSFVSEVPHHVAGAVFTDETIVLVGAAVAVSMVLSLFYSRTRVGWALTAIAHDREAAVMRGIPVAPLGLIAFAIGGALAAATGFVAGPVIGASPSMGFGYALSGFVAAAAGGIPDVRGALFGGLAVGIIEAAGVQVFGAGYRDVVIFAVLLCVLVARPYGLFGRGVSRAV